MLNKWNKRIGYSKRIQRRHYDKTSDISVALFAILENVTAIFVYSHKSRECKCKM